jgi:hypothetical protein
MKEMATKSHIKNFSKPFHFSGLFPYFVEYLRVLGLKAGEA